MGTYGNEYASFKRASVTMSAANTFTQETINLPVDIAKNLVFCIWKIEWFQSAALDAMVQDDSWLAQLTRASKTTIVGIDDTQLIDSCQRKVSVLTSGGAIQEDPIVHIFDPPIPVAKEEIYLGVNTVGDADANGVKIRITYTLRELKDADFVKSLLRDQ